MMSKISDLERIENKEDKLNPFILKYEEMEFFPVVDYFAGLAMQSLLRRASNLEYSTLELVSQNAYKIADLMMVEREKK